MTFALRAWVLCCLLLSVTACGKQSDTVVAIAPHPRNPDILYVATNESLYKTRDGGATWSKMTTHLSSFRVLTLGVDPHSPANVLAGTMGDAVYKSPDGGQSWTPHNGGLKEHISVVNQFVFHPTDPDIIYAATTVGVFRSKDGGRLWEERMYGMKEVHYVVTLAMDPHNPDVMYAGTDGGETWGPSNEGLTTLNIRSMALSPLNPQIVYAGTNGSGLFRSMDGAKTWTHVPLTLSPKAAPLAPTI